MRKIKLTRGKVALVDDEDFEELNKHNWQVQKNKDRNNWYAVRTDHSGKKQKTVRMHSLILNTPKLKQTDHIDGNGLNNQRSNLRIATSSQNSWNAKIRKDNTSGYKGVCWHKLAKKWLVSISYNGKLHYLGLSEDKHQAALVYNVAANYLFGNYAKLNKIGGA